MTHARRLQLAVAALLVSGTLTLAHEGATGIIKDRMDHMKTIKETMKVLAPLMKGDVTYDAAQVRTLALRLSAKGGDAMTELFPEGSIQGKSEALPAIWQDWGQFTTSAMELQESAALLAATAANPRDDSPQDPWKAFERVVGTCRGCHDDFRKG